jgi:DNA-binding transcriptional ArsR family regulator
MEMLVPMNCNVDCTADVLKAIAHPTRLRILCTLNLQEMPVQTLVEKTGATQSNLSQHLSLLKDRKILVTRRDANRIFYRIRNTQLLELIQLMRDIYCREAA